MGKFTPLPITLHSISSGILQWEKKREGRRTREVVMGGKVNISKIGHTEYKKSGIRETQNLSFDANSISISFWFNSLPLFLLRGCQF